MKELYTIPRADFFNIPNYNKISIGVVGSLWMTILLDEDEVFLLWTQGIVTTPYRG